MEDQREKADRNDAKCRLQNVDHELPNHLPAPFAGAVGFAASSLITCSSSRISSSVSLRRLRQLSHHWLPKKSAATKEIRISSSSSVPRGFTRETSGSKIWALLIYADTTQSFFAASSRYTTV